MSLLPIELVESAQALPFIPATGDIHDVLPLLKLMSEPNRLKIFSLLTVGERCVCEIEESMQLPQNLISHHLGVLRDAGYIRARRDGRWVYYSVNKDKLSEIYPVLCRLFNPECVTDGPQGEQPSCRIC